MKIREVTILIIGLCTLFILPAYAGPYTGKKIFHVCSYHEGYEWSDGVKEGIDKVLIGKGIIFKTFDMDTKRNSDEEFKRAAGLEAKKIIDRFSPDVIIISDDNAFKYLVMPFYRDADIPVVFCGINWDASIYEIPYSNTTGMVEVNLIEPAIKALAQYANGQRVGFLDGDVFTARKELEHYKNIAQFECVARYVTNFEQWKEGFIAMQDEADMLILRNNGGIAGWDDEAAGIFVREHTKIPTGTTMEHMAKFVLLSFAKSPQEQGEWAAQAALRIIDGEKPADIEISQNKKGRLFINLGIADNLGIIFSPTKLKHAEIISE